MAEAVDYMVVDHPHPLHVGVADRRANESEAPLPQVIAHGLRLWSCSWNLRHGASVALVGLATHEGPLVPGEASELQLDGHQSPGILDVDSVFQMAAAGQGVKEIAKS